MNQHPTRRRDVGVGVVRRVQAKYEAEGFAVSLGERLPPPNDDYIADAIARSGDETIVIEIQPADTYKARHDRLERLAEIRNSEPGWRFVTETYEIEPPPPDPKRDDAIRRVGEAKRVADTSSEAALMLVWSAVEGALIKVSRDQNIPKIRSGRPRALVHDLVIHGVLSDNQYRELDRFARVREAVAHGLSAELPSEDELDWLARFALAAVEDMVPTVEDMAYWYNSEGGETIRAETGYDIADILHHRFRTALESDIAEAVTLIESKTLLQMHA